MKKIYVIYTGGTIGMRFTEHGLAPEAGFLKEQIEKISVLSNEAAPEIVFKEYSPLIDSSQVTYQTWNKIANDIAARYAEFDGFVILHGTDTMAYTGSALAFMLENLDKPVVLTGAQTSIAYAMNDARQNLINAIYIAANIPICEVCIFFNNLLFRANRTTKVSTLKFNAYESPLYPPLGSIGPSVEVNTDMLLKPTSKWAKLRIRNFIEVDIRCVVITPSLTAKALKQLLSGAKAVILETYGDGNMPVTKEFLAVLQQATSAGTIIIHRSQCLYSRTSSEKYSPGNALSKTGVISAGGQTIEAISCKLHYLFSLGLSVKDIKEKINCNLRGEVTVVQNVAAHQAQISCNPTSSNRQLSRSGTGRMNVSGSDRSFDNWCVRAGL